MARNLIVINVDFKETRVALIEEGVIAELQIERVAHRSTVGNIVLGRVTRVLPGMQAAFIDVGQERAAFLHVEDLIRPNDFDAYLASDAREKVKLKSVAGSNAEATPEDEAEAVVEALPKEALDAGGRSAARRGRRRRGRRGRGRERLPGTEAALDSGTDAAAEGEFDELTPAAAALDGDSADAAEVDDDDFDESTDDEPDFIERSGIFDDIEFGESREDSDFEEPGVAAAAEDEHEEFEFDDSPDDDSADADDEPVEADEDDEELGDADDEEADIGVGDDARAAADDELDEEDSDEESFDDDDVDLDEADDDDSDPEEDAAEESDVDNRAAPHAAPAEWQSGQPGLASAHGDSSRSEIDFPHAASALDAEESGPESRELPSSQGKARAYSDDSEASAILTAFGRHESTTELGFKADSDRPDRPSRVQLVPPGVSGDGEEEPPPSGERELPEGDVAAFTRDADLSGTEAVGADETTDEESEPEDESGAGETSTDDGSAEGGAEGRRRRGRRRRRRGGKEPVVATAAPVEQGAVPALPADNDANRRGRRRRGRRRGGVRVDSKPVATEVTPVAATPTDTARRMPLRVSRSVPITEVVKEGDQVVVQISKEPIGTKGARVTSHVSLPGRYVVYLPTVDHIGISKRIGNARERARLRKSIEAIKPANGGLIVRTVAEGLTKKQLKADIGYLIKVWADVAKRREAARPAEVLYEELDLVLKAARDLFTDEVQQIVIDDREQHGRLCRFVEMFMPGRVKDIKLYSGEEPIFDAYGIEDEIKRALSRKVPLPSGGSLIMDQAEALTAIDVNTGRYVGKGSKDLEETALKTNLEAVDEIAYQLRFRNIGGLVILDLIDMEKADNREKVWRALEQKLAKDKAKTTINRISDLGLIEMTRKRTRESLGRIMHEPCFYCDGTGNIQSRETIAYEILRQIRRDRMSLTGYSVRVLAHPAVVDFLKHEARDALQEAERRYMRRIELVPKQEYHVEQYDLQGR